jgi:hypothetical protein
MWWKIHMSLPENREKQRNQRMGHAHEWCGLFENHFLSLIKEQGEMSSRICDFRGNCPKEASRRSIVK